ncbi:MAG: autoinducer binding domain-containing protein [Verrucomicrobia bacterium]|nr:autoinducer binding domain-containing protein [Verrucomicrobiota bacterium]
MLNWKEIVQNYISKYSNLIRAATKPLRDRLGLKYFTYHKIDKQGKYTVLVDRPDWAEHYVGEKYYLVDPYLRHPDVYRSGVCMIGCHGSEEFKEKLHGAAKKFDLEQNVLFIDRSEDCVEFYGYSGSKRESTLDRAYLNHPWIFKAFAGFFKRELGAILRQMEGEAGSLIELKGGDFFCPEPINPSLDDEFEAYLKEIGQGEDLEKIKLLSPREKQCIRLFADGKSAKKTGVDLGLSPRTVESYFENMKNKLSCHSKQEILARVKPFLDLWP